VVSDFAGSHVELTVPLTGPKVLATSPACSGVRQRAFTPGGVTAPFINVVDVTFQFPGSTAKSDASAETISAREHNNVIPNLVICVSFPAVMCVHAISMRRLNKPCPRNPEVLPQPIVEESDCGERNSSIMLAAKPIARISGAGAK
jgi:hypothetical protein